jgi:hypothetical protein
LQASWPKDGVVLVFCKNGKYWAGMVSPDLENVSDVLDELKQQAKAKQTKELLEICGRQVNRKLAVQ